jgi:hypothetical protein
MRQTTHDVQHGNEVIGLAQRITCGVVESHALVKDTSEERAIERWWALGCSDLKFGES